MKSRLSLEYSHSVHKFFSVDPLNKKALLGMSTKNAKLFKKLRCCVAIFYFCFEIFYEIYKEFIV